jgi:hypothetical protein
MPNKTYAIRYLPLFYDDLEINALYIAEELNNPQAAIELMNAVKAAIDLISKDRVPTDGTLSLLSRIFPAY